MIMKCLWIAALVLGMTTSATAQINPTHDEFLPGCGRGFGVDGQGNALVYAWAEGIDWDGSDGIPMRPAWVSWWNPRTTPQILTLTTSDPAGVQTVRTITMPPLARGANGLRALFGWSGRVDFALHAACESTCIVSLITWDGGYSFPSEVNGVRGCRVSDWPNPYTGLLVPWFLDGR